MLQTELFILCHQLPPNHPQIRQREQRVQLSRVLRQSAVADLGVPKLALDDAEGVFDLGPHAGLQALDLVDESPEPPSFSEGLRELGRRAICQFTPGLASGGLSAPR